MSALTTAHVIPVVPSSRDWTAAAACAHDRSGLDLVELTDKARRDAEADDLGLYRIHLRHSMTYRHYEEDVAAAAELCAGCPVLAACRRSALTGGPMAGFVAGMTETTREEVRRGRTVHEVTAADVVPATALTATWVEEQDRGTRRPRGRLSDNQVRAVAAMVRADFTTQQIATRLCLEPTTVDYVRQVLAGSKTRRRA